MGSIALQKSLLARLMIHGVRPIADPATGYVHQVLGRGRTTSTTCSMGKVACCLGHLPNKPKALLIIVAHVIS